MSKRFTTITVALSAAVAFLVGVIIAGGLTPYTGRSTEPRTPPANDKVRPARSNPAPAIVNFADVAERINAAVVNIEAASKTPFGREPSRFTRPGDGGDGQRDLEAPRQGAGSGFIVDREGYLLTNHHVVEGAERITVTLADGRVFRGEVVGADPAIDVALVKIPGAPNLPEAPLGDSDELRAGEWVCAIGNPLGYVHSITVGVVSFIGRKLFDQSLDDYIQTDAAINYGNSGGPLINARGEVVGINSAISSRASNIGFAVPINQAVEILPQLKAKGRVSRGFIGVTLTDVTPGLQRALGLSVSEGAMVQDVTPRSPAERAGLKPYDVITEVEDQGPDQPGADSRHRGAAARDRGQSGDRSRGTPPVAQRQAGRAAAAGRGARPRRRPRPAGAAGAPGGAAAAAGRQRARVRSRLRRPPGDPGSRAGSDRRPRRPDRRGSPGAPSRPRDHGDQSPRGDDRRRVRSSRRRGARRRRARDLLLQSSNGPALAGHGRRRLSPPARTRFDESPHPHNRRRGRGPRSVGMILRYDDYEVLEASSGPEGIAMVERESPDLVFLDIKMPGMDGLDVLQKLRSTNDDLPVVIISGHGTVSTAVEATKAGAFDFIEKPPSSDKLLLTIRNALERTRLSDENRTLRRAAEVRHQMVGESAGLRQIWDAIKRAAPTNATVLLQGESGVGKELVARSIHRNSLRSRERFIQVNCAAIPEELIESELFGHEKGSFTGATEKQIGKFEQADRGTIFLDEVGDMSAKTQAKVLRVLQEGEVERLGSARTIKVDVRVIAATNKDLEQEIEKGAFREDLYFRLSVIPIKVPALRERRDDIPALVRHFADLFSRENNRKLPKFTAAALEHLQKARWKGNVRELKNTVERLIIMTPGEAIDVDDLRDIVRIESKSVVVEGEKDRPGTLREFKESAERAFLVDKLRENGWNISKTAEVIGTPRSNLYKKLEQYRHQPGSRRLTSTRNAKEHEPPQQARRSLLRLEGEESPNSAGQCAG